MENNNKQIERDGHAPVKTEIVSSGFVHGKNITTVLAAVLLLVIPVWIWLVTSQLTKLPKDFSYRADIVSSDNFYFV